MRHLRMVGLCLAAVFAMAAVLATSASALPEWGQCFVQAKHEGKYANSSCTVKAKKVSEKFTGGFEWRKSTEVTQKNFEGGNVGSGGVLTSDFQLCEGGNNPEGRHPGKCREGESEAFAAVSVECTAEHNTGVESGTKEVKNIAVIFTGCKSLGFPCSNTVEAEKILVNTLKGTLGYINKAKKEVGLMLEPIIKKGAFANFTCGPLAVVVGVGNEKEGAAYSPEKTGGYDGIISPITPVNTMTAHFTQIYTMNATFENIPSKFEGKHIELLESYLYNPEKPTFSSKWSKAGQTLTNETTGEVEAEIKA
jgi:hypothetical protein